MSGVRVELVSIVLMALTALAIVTLIRVAGVILSIALLTLPAAVARQWSETLPAMMWKASVVCAACIGSGLLLSLALSVTSGLSLPPGPLIIVVATVVYGGSSALRAWVRPARSDPAIDRAQPA